MQLVLKSLLLLVLATLLHATKGRMVSVKLGRRNKLKDKTVRLILDSSVSLQMTSPPASTIANMSLSPWTYRESCMESRFPRQIAHAQCLTAGCLSLQGGREEDASLVAKPIYYQVLVLHRIPRHNNKGGWKRRKYDFRLGMEVVTVGCTCVRPSVVPQGNRGDA
uniref:Interleukin 17A/F3 n=1 Tax=Miichthys miiuy TaxID=240162 RepID=A0A0U3SCX5_MIIMI|nr:interleukin 17A/F3 [Miichthys miiuy]